MINLAVYYLKKYLKKRIKDRKFNDKDCNVFKNPVFPKKEKIKIFQSLVYDYNLLKLAVYLISSDIEKKDIPRGYFDFKYYSILPEYRKIIYLNIMKPLIYNQTYTQLISSIEQKELKTTLKK